MSRSQKKSRAKSRPRLKGALRDHPPTKFQQACLIQLVYSIGNIRLSGSVAQAIRNMGIQLEQYRDDEGKKTFYVRDLRSAIRARQILHYAE